MNPRIAPFEPNDLPRREKSFWRMTGPGAVMVGLAIGSGEMVLWPWITAKFGAGMAWAAVLGIFMQMWVNFEIGRWAVATGESAFTGFARISRKLIFGFMAVLFTLAWLPGWARATAVCIRYLLFGLEDAGPDWQWAIAVYLCIFGLLFGPRRIYTTIERVVSAMVLVIVFGMVAVAWRIGSAADLGELARGLANVGHIETAADFSFLRFFGAMVFVGAGGFGQLYYAYYLREKGIGMGARIAELTSALRDGDSAGTYRETGYLYRDNEENARRFRDWFSFVKQDNVLYFFLLNTFVTLLFMFGALVVLHARGIVPAERDIIWDLSQMLESIMGTFGHYLFLVIALCAMFSSQLAISDGTYRIWTDMLHTNFAFARRLTAGQWYFALAAALGPIGVFSIWFFENYGVGVLDFFFVNAALNGCAMAVWVPLVLYMNLRFLPRSARPGGINIVAVSLAALFYLSFAVYICVDKARDLLAAG